MVVEPRTNGNEPFMRTMSKHGLQLSTPSTIACGMLPPTFMEPRVLRNYQFLGTWQCICENNHKIVTFKNNPALRVVCLLLPIILLSSITDLSS
jgi:hypothetical protein